MKYYVVSEKLLDELACAAFDDASSHWTGGELDDRLKDAKAACRQHPLSRMEVERLTHHLRQSAVSGYDWSWDFFEMNGAIDEFLKRMGVEE
jgi:hypothetical protein